MDRQSLDVAGFSNELKLMLALIKDDNDSIQAFIKSSINWHVFLKVIKHHRLYPIIYRKLQ